MPRKCVIEGKISHGWRRVSYELQREKGKGSSPTEMVEDPAEGVAREAKGGVVSSVSYSHQVSNYEFT